MSEKFDIFSKIFFRDVGNFVRYLCVLVLRHQMRVSNYFVNSFYSVLYLTGSSVLYLTGSKMLKKFRNSINYLPYLLMYTVTM